MLLCETDIIGKLIFMNKEYTFRAFGLSNNGSAEHTQNSIPIIANRSQIDCWINSKHLLNYECFILLYSTFYKIYFLLFIIF